MLFGLRGMKFIVIIGVAALLVGCSVRKAVRAVLAPFSAEERLAEAEEMLREAKDDYWRLFPLGKAGMACVDLGKNEEAKRYADELLALSSRLYPKEGDADAIHNGNLILGRLALRAGDVEKAKEFLLTAGRVKGSPVLNSFGPNMALAKEMLDHGERAVVLQYFDLCGAFWKMHEDNLRLWSKQVRDGTTPNFGANLIY